MVQPSTHNGAQGARDPPPQSADTTTLQRAKTNLAYLALGSGAAVAPNSLATRSALTTTRYVSWHPLPLLTLTFPRSLSFHVSYSNSLLSLSRPNRTSDLLSLCHLYPARVARLNDAFLSIHRYHDLPAAC